MNVLDEHLRQAQRELLATWRIPVRQIGVEVGRSGMQDDEIISLLHRLSRPTLFTRDRDFYAPDLRHARYCLVRLDVPRSDSAEYIRRLLKHPSFDTIAKRLGNVIRVSQSGLHVWRLNAEAEEAIRLAQLATVRPDASHPSSERRLQRRAGIHQRAFSLSTTTYLP